jgi:hypothetical protein
MADGLVLPEASNLFVFGQFEYLVGYVGGLTDEMMSHS